MKLRPSDHIDLTGHLGSLKSSLSPDCKLFEPSPPLWQIADRPHPARSFRPLTLAFMIFWAAIILYHLAAS